MRLGAQRVRLQGPGAREVRGAAQRDTRAAEGEESFPGRCGEGVTRLVTQNNIQRAGRAHETILWL